MYDTKDQFELLDKLLTCTYNTGPNEIGKVDPKNTKTRRKSRDAQQVSWPLVSHFGGTVVSRHATGDGENQSLPLCRKESMSYQPKKGEVENDRKWMSMQDIVLNVESKRTET